MGGKAILMLVQAADSALVESSASVGRRPVSYRIQPSYGLIPIDLGELWRYRELSRFFILRDVKARYRQTFLGPAWAILQAGS